MTKKNKKIKRVTEDRNAKAIREAKLRKDMTNPINKFLNEIDENQRLIYKYAPIMREYFINAPDAAHNAFRMANSLLHELRFHQDQSKRYYDAYNGKDEMFNKDNRKMTKEECYTAHIFEKQVGHTVMDKLRQHLIQGVLVTVDGELFTFEQYDEYLSKIDKIVTELGYELFPKNVTVIEPL